MKIALIILGIIAIGAFLGMFYWMWKARNGELNLKKDSWHVKLLQYMWEFEIWGNESASDFDLALFQKEFTAQEATAVPGN